jgi:hypothetical protein
MMAPPTRDELLALFERFDAAQSKLNDMINWYNERPSVRVKFARHKYDNSVRTDVSAYDFYDVQRGGVLTGNSKPGAELYIYATIVKCAGDSFGYRQFMPPSAVKDEWLARTTGGALIERGSGNDHDYLIDISNVAWQTEAVKQIVSSATTYNANVYVDEVDWTYIYPWPQLASGLRIKTMQTQAAWQAAWLDFLTRLATALHLAGKKLWINFGANYDLADPWQFKVANVVDGINIEFFGGREGVKQPPTSVNDGWPAQVAFVADVERQLQKAAHVHCSSNSQEVIDYAFYSWLLGTEFNGSFAAGLTYGVRDYLPSAVAQQGAAKLGAPLGPYDIVDPGLYRRKFVGGLVTVNPRTTFRGGMAAFSGNITIY